MVEIGKQQAVYQDSTARSRCEVSLLSSPNDRVCDQILDLNMSYSATLYDALAQSRARVSTLSAETWSHVDLKHNVCRTQGRQTLGARYASAACV